MSGSTVSLLSVLLGVLCSSSTVQAFTLSVPRQQLGSFRAAESRFVPPLRDQASSNLDVESLVDKAVAPSQETDTTTKSSVVLMGIDPLLTLDEKQLERDEKYMREAIKMALSA
jgi:hypothetical protein